MQAECEQIHSVSPSTTLLAVPLASAASAVEAPGEASAATNTTALKRSARRLAAAVMPEHFSGKYPILCLFVLAPDRTFQVLHLPLCFVLSLCDLEGEEIQPEVAGVSPKPRQVPDEPSQY